MMPATTAKRWALEEELSCVSCRVEEKKEAYWFYQYFRLLKSTNNKSFDQCLSCLSGKMSKKPFSYRTGKATDILGLIHTDVCGPLRYVSRQGATYFITFTDDFRPYGYVYLLKHKHKVFETFKDLKNEVKNQLGKTINITPGNATK
nr:retrotransposon protein, putative, Ty1-copia subclass [Tanacetum cinerariifolium]